MAPQSRHLRNVCLIIVVLITGLISACDASRQSSLENAGSETIIVSPDTGLTDLSLLPPARVRSVSAIDPAAITAKVAVEGVETELQLDANGRFVGAIEVPAQSTFSLSLVFSELYAGEVLPLATTEQIVNTGTSDTTLNLLASEYVYDVFDFDGDSVSNIIERENDTNPIDATEIPALAAVEVFAFRPAVTSDVGFTNYDMEVQVGVDSHVQPAAEGSFTHTFNVARRAPLVVQLRLIENQTGERLVIASQTTTLDEVNDYNFVEFTDTNYFIAFDTDGDGVSDINELVAGTDVFIAPVVMSQNDFTVTFAVPAEISQPESAFSRLLVDGDNVDLTRADNTYTANASAAEGTAVDIFASINDNYLGQVVTMATYNLTATPQNAEVVELFDYSLNIDDDGDGVFNFQEIADGSDPFNSPPACTPVTEFVELQLSDDAYVFTDDGAISDGGLLRVEYDERIVMIRYQFDTGLGTVKSATLSLTVANDPGDGSLSVYSIPDFEWNDLAASTNLPVYGPSVASMNQNWDRATQYDFALDTSAITSDFTLLIEQGTDSNDVAFDSSNNSNPPVLTVEVERCE